MSGALRFICLPLTVSGLVRVNSYLIWDEESREALVVDPGDEVYKIAELLSEKKLGLKYIVLTHGHFDHISGTAELKRLSSAAVCMSERERHYIADRRYNAVWLMSLPDVERFEIDIALYDAQQLNLGDELIRVIETPGHTEGHISLYYPGHLFCGDTILRGGTGRMDLPGADHELIERSVRERIYSLPDDTLLHCGHNEVSCVIYEKQHGAFRA